MHIVHIKTKKSADVESCQSENINNMLYIMRAITTLTVLTFSLTFMVTGLLESQIKPKCFVMPF